MANLTTLEKQLLERLFQMGGWYVLDFSDRTMGEFFKDDLGITIYDQKYAYASGSKANYMRGFWSKADDVMVGKSVLWLVGYIENKILLGDFKTEDFPKERIEAGRKLGSHLLGKGDGGATVRTEAVVVGGNINIHLQKDVFSHIQKLLSDGYYFNAVEEAYKIVRQKLKNITGKEKAHEGFSEDNYLAIFGHDPKNDAEKDFFEWVKFLHMAIQKLRNEKAHTPAEEMDRNLAVHYIVLASLAYDLIDR